MKKLIISNLVTLALAAMLFGSFRPIPVEAQAAGTISSWITSERQSANQLVNWAQFQLQLDAEYRAGGYSTLITANIGASGTPNFGLTQADVTTAEGNMTAIANAVLAPPGTTFPISIAVGTNTTVFKIK